MHRTGLDDLIEGLLERREALTIVVDAVDEADDPPRSPGRCADWQARRQMPASACWRAPDPAVLTADLSPTRECPPATRTRR
jgi:hypothetical protein